MRARRELDETIVTRETALERVGRSIEEGKRRAAELEREKNQLVRSLQSGKGGDEGRAKEAERLKEINEQLSFSVKMAQQRTEGQAGKEKEVMSMLEQHREREREMMRELRELRGLIEKGDTQGEQEFHRLLACFFSPLPTMPHFFQQISISSFSRTADTSVVSSRPWEWWTHVPSLLCSRGGGVSWLAPDDDDR